jgi:RPA family protein
MSEKISEIKDKAKNWAKSQSKEKLERIKQISKEIKGNTFDEELQIKWTINAIDIELYRRSNEEVLKTKEELLSIFK